jgi:hypothetical protein
MDEVQQRRALASRVPLAHGWDTSLATACGAEQHSLAMRWSGALLVNRSGPGPPFLGEQPDKLGSEFGVLSTHARWERR